jgi:FAS-associated factor 2
MRFNSLVAIVLKATSYPFVAIIAPAQVGGGNERLMCLDRIDGACSTETLIGKLRQQNEKFQTAAENLRAEKQRRIMERNLRSQQDSAYEASLRVDREKVTILLYLILKELKMQELSKQQDRAKREAQVIIYSYSRPESRILPCLSGISRPSHARMSPA